MSSLMGKAMTDVDLIWVVPKVKDLEYPPGDPAEPIEVIIFGEPYLIEVETHVLDNITYVILDSPVFRAQTKADPYPARMDDLSSAIFYSTWNQAIAATIKRFPLVDIYHVNDYHGALAPLYLLPKVLPICLSLHNAEFQGLWPLRTKEEMKEVCSAFNLSKEVCTKVSINDIVAGSFKLTPLDSTCNSETPSTCCMLPHPSSACIRSLLVLPVCQTNTESAVGLVTQPCGH